MTEPVYPRDLIGYGQHEPHDQWPGAAKNADQFGFSYVESGENFDVTGGAGA